MTLRAPRGAGRVLLALAGPALLAGHTLAHSADLDLAGLDAWRRRWSDLALATAAWVDAAYGPAPQRVVARGDEAEARARRLILERIERDGLRPTRPLATELKTMASWLKLDSIAVARPGDLARFLAAALRA